MIDNIDKMIDYFKQNISGELVILTDYKEFSLFDDKEKGIDLENGINTYKGCDVILRDDMPPNNSWGIMTREDFERNNK